MPEHMISKSNSGIKFKALDFDAKTHDFKINEWNEIQDTWM